MASGVWRASVPRLEHAEDDVIRPGREEVGKKEEGPRCKTLSTDNPNSFTGSTVIVVSSCCPSFSPRVKMNRTNSSLCFLPSLMPRPVSGQLQHEW